MPEEQASDGPNIGVEWQRDRSQGCAKHGSGCIHATTPKSRQRSRRVQQGRGRGHVMYQKVKTNCAAEAKWDASEIVRDKTPEEPPRRSGRRLDLGRYLDKQRKGIGEASDDSRVLFHRVDRRHRWLRLHRLSIVTRTAQTQMLNNLGVTAPLRCQLLEIVKVVPATDAPPVAHRRR